MADTALTHKCPNCGGPLLFDPKTQKFHCEYCLSSFTEAEVLAFEQKNEPSETVDASSNLTENQATPDEPKTDDVGLFVCPSCGAEIVTTATTASTFCVYCHNPVVLTERLSGEFLPEKVLPFQIEHKEAEADFLTWVNKKRYVPKEFFDKKQIQNLTGVYYPYWVVEGDLIGTMNAQATNLRVWIVGDIEYTETKRYQIYRAGTTNFKNLVKNALQKNEPEKIISSVQPFDLTASIDFKNQYLSGFQTEKRDIEFDQMKENVEDELRQYSDALMQQTISGYQMIDSVDSNQQITDLSNHYVLLPIWLVTYRQKNSDKLFYYAMNGQTGKVAGVLPIDKAKLIREMLAIFIIIAIVGIFIGYMISA